MKDEIIEICRELKNLNHCTACGGTYNQGACKYCGLENERMKYLIIRLEKELANLDITSFQVGKMEPCLNHLYIIYQMQIPSVNKLLDNLHYPQTIFSVSKEISEKQEEYFKNNYNFSKEGFDLLLFFCLEDPSSISLTGINALMKAMLEENDNFKYSTEDRRKLYLRFMESSSKTLHSKYSLIIKPNISNFNNGANAACLNLSIFLDDKTFSMKDEEIFNSIFHEYIHTGQNRDIIYEKKLSGLRLMQTKDYILDNYLDGYYDANYTVNSREREAFANSRNEAIAYFSSIGYKCSDKFYNDAISSYSSFSQLDDKRTYNGKDTTLNEVFNDFIKTQPDFLLLYPQLGFEYKLTSEGVVTKTKEDYISDYEQFQSGILKWNGNSEEITQMYMYKINGLNNENNFTHK